MTGGTPSGHRLRGISWMRLLSTSPSVVTSTARRVCFGSLAAACRRAGTKADNGRFALVGGMSLVDGAGAVLNML